MLPQIESTLIVAGLTGHWVPCGPTQTRQRPGNPGRWRPDPCCPAACSRTPGTLYNHISDLLNYNLRKAADVPRRKNLCELYEKGDHTSGWRTNPGPYHAIVRTDELPASYDREDGYLVRGYAVDLDRQWFFFSDMAPAVTFGRAGRMAAEVSSYGVTEAAYWRQCCNLDLMPSHLDHLVLLIGHGGPDRGDDDLQLGMMKRFVQSAKENAWSSNWHEPTGYVTDYNNGRPRQSTTSSLPL